MPGGIFDLDSRVILVTGAGAGIGRATTLTLAKQGATVLAADIDFDTATETVGLAEADKGLAHAIELDVTAAHQWKTVIDRLAIQFGRLDALVNNAGIMITVPFMETTLEQFEKTISINTKSVFIGVLAALPLMRQTRESVGTLPSIVNLSSIYGNMAGPAHVAYCASKGAVRTMSKGMAVELAPEGIRVNTVHPGPVDTQLLAGALESLAARGRMPGADKAMAAVARAHPMGRTAVPGDVAGVIAFLCSDASSFMTGAELVVDGGYGLL